MPQSIVSTLNQPIIYSADDDVTCKCGEREHCVLIEPNQQVYSQLKISPCRTIEVCNNSLGPNLITNGTFDANLSGWTVGAGWTWAAGAACNDGGPNGMDQTIAITAGDIYQVVFDILNYDSGELSLLLGGTLYGTGFTADGTYGVYLAAGAGTDIRFDSNPDFIGCIDNVSVRKVISCWDADQTDWTTTATGACHETGNTTDLTNTGTVLVSGQYYHITINITNSTAGGVNVVLGTTVLSPQSSGNGLSHFWGVSSGADLIIRPTTDFDGCIEGLLVDEYCNEYKFHLIPASGDEFEVFDLTTLYTRFEDTYNLTDFRMSDIFKSGTQLPYGCYKFCLVDCCTEQHTADSLLSNSDFADGYEHWTAQGVTIAGGQATFLSGFELNFLQQALITTHDADCVEIEFAFGNEAPFTSATIRIYINGALVDTDLLAPGAGFYNNTFSNIPAGAIIRFETDSLVGDLIIDDIIVTVPEDCQPIYDQCTPCINYQADFACTKLIEGWNTGNKLGFVFDDANGNNYFKLSLRAKCELLHSSYDEEQTDYDFSTGDSELSYFQSTKYESLTFYPIPTYKHDVVRLQKGCKNIQIDGIDYFARKGNYVVEWNKNTSTDLAPSRVEVKKKSQTLFNTNCS